MNTIEHDSSTHRFSTQVGQWVASLDYTLTDGQMVITHTYVPPPINGRGIAAALMSAALKAARSSGWTVEAACSYAAAYMRRHSRGEDREHEENLLDEALQESFPASDPPSIGGMS